MQSFRERGKAALRTRKNEPATDMTTIPEDAEAANTPTSSLAMSPLPNTPASSLAMSPLNIEKLMKSVPSAPPGQTSADVTYRKHIADVISKSGHDKRGTSWTTMIMSARKTERNVFQKLLARLPEVQKCFEPEYGLPRVQLSVEIESVQKIEIEEQRVTLRYGVALDWFGMHARAQILSVSDRRPTVDHRSSPACYRPAGRGGLRQIEGDQDLLLRQ